MNRPTCVLIAGPTASGKSALAIAIAERYRGTVINADSMQVYRDLRVLTARPSKAEEARVPHALFGHVDGGDTYSTGRFVADASVAIAQARTDRRLPIVVGGTGLYFKALLEGLAPVPDIPEDIRAHWRGEVARIGVAAAHALLVACDPETAARLRPSDPQRISRALEVWHATGRSLADWQRQRSTPIVDLGTAMPIALNQPRAPLLARCDARFMIMLDSGAAEEVRALIERNLPPRLPVMQAIGVTPIARMLVGEIDRTEAIRLGQIQTRQYVKRQMTWLSRHMIAWNIIQSHDNCEIMRSTFALIDD